MDLIVRGANLPDGRTGIDIAVKDGKGLMVDWAFKDGAKYLPSDAEVMKMRPAK